MRVVLADLKGLRGFVSKDTVVGGYGSRLQPFSRVTRFSVSSSADCTTHPACSWPILRRSPPTPATR